MNIPAMKEINQQIEEAKSGLNAEINAIASQQAPSSNSAQQGLTKRISSKMKLH